MRGCAAGPGIQVIPRSSSRLNAGGSTLALASSLATAGALWMTSAAGTSVTGLAGSAQGSVPAWHAATGTYLDSSRAWAIATTLTVGLLTENTTAAANGAQQYGCALASIGRGWGTTAGESVACAVGIYAKPVQGTTPTVTMDFATRIGAAAWTTPMSLSSGGALTVNNIGCVNMNASTSLGVFGDRGSGAASYTIFSNATVAAGSGNDPTFIKVPGSAAAAQQGWMKLYIGATTYVIPYWAAA
jgi:hypothetical protein